MTEKKDSESVVSPSLVTDRDEWSTALRMETTRRKIIRLPSIQDENSQVWICKGASITLVLSINLCIDLGIGWKCMYNP